ncbi:serine/threonine-protein kinase EDR1-like [Eucalyptus grandis]|uniref:serine/threonine-protein kinase EDR1-like n=1 Tax=Eucalyptus grandis TaxID=71139 RepID=UPI00192E9A61|nr:serine/threonine-protein kinase EDR1-like [Eucalyptus grandis]
MVAGRSLQRTDRSWVAWQGQQQAADVGTCADGGTATSAWAVRLWCGGDGGSLFCLLQRNTAKLDWRRRVHMALDVVSDFGLSRLKSKAYLTVKTGKGTPQWMAPEVLRNEASDEKSDVYSYGVVLWEIATQKIPWDNLNAVQVIGAVGFINQRLDIPHDVDPQWASIIESCWHSDPKCRSTF